MNKMYYLFVSYKAQSKTEPGLMCEGNVIFSVNEPFTYDDFMEKIAECVNKNKDSSWATPTIVSINELSEGLFNQLASRR